MMFEIFMNILSQFHYIEKKFICKFVQKVKSYYEENKTLRKYFITIYTQCSFSKIHHNHRKWIKINYFLSLYFFLEIKSDAKHTF